MKAPVYNQKGEKKGDVTLNASMFGIEVNEGLMHQALVMQLTNTRKPIAHTKTRGEVRGGGRKPHRQKGTGRARLGSSRTVQQRGGGVTFGPRNTRNFSVMMPKKQRRKAIFSALSAKAKEKQVFVLDEYKADSIKAKTFSGMLKKLPVDRNVLVVIPEKNENVQLSTRNLANAKSILANYLNIRDLLKYHSLMFVTKEALEKAEETFLESEKEVKTKAAKSTKASSRKTRKVKKTEKKAKAKASSDK